MSQPRYPLLIHELLAPVLSGLEISAEAKRFFHGRGQRFPDLGYLNVDLYPPYIHVVSYKELIASEVDCLKNFFQSPYFSDFHGGVIQVRSGAKVSHYPFGDAIEKTWWVRERDLEFLVDLGNKQNTGLFLDNAPLRSWLQDNARGKRILNLFAYTATLSVAALRGGASHVVNVDMSKSALATGWENHRRNGFTKEQVSFLGYEILRSWGKLRKLGPYDLVIIDPPSFQKGSFDVQKDYAKVLRKLPSALAPQADVIACLNSPYLGHEFLQQLFDEQLPELSFKACLLSADYVWETDVDAGLKIHWYQTQ